MNKPDTVELTEAETAFLLRQPDVAITLARFNRAQCHQTASETVRMQLFKRTKMFEKMAR